MSDKPLAILVTALAIAPVCAVCILGTAAVGVGLAGVLGWFSDLGPLATTSGAIFAALLAYRLIQRNRGRMKRRRQASRRIGSSSTAGVASAAQSLEGHPQ